MEQDLSHQTNDEAFDWLIWLVNHMHMQLKLSQTSFNKIQQDRILHTEQDDLLKFEIQSKYLPKKPVPIEIVIPYPHRTMS